MDEKPYSKNKFSRRLNYKTKDLHRVPPDLQKILTSDNTALAFWKDITPLARNEWICWVENAKQLKTRIRRIERTCSELKEGMRRPCCWAGCPHR